MPISVERYQSHVQEWEKKAVRPYWPRHLFHYAHVTCAAAILTDGRLTCRADQGDELIHDVAEPGAIAANTEAHEYVRLYFRPKTNFHLSTEGIKFRDDRYRKDLHMSVPIVLMMDASILTRDGVGYSNRKLAHYDARPLFDEQAFDSIEFSDVYHEGPTGGRDRVIQDRRMAEVVVPGHLELNNCLRHVVCRTRLDEITLRQLAARAPENVISKIRVAQNPTDFFLCRDTFISHLEYVDASLFLKLFQGRNYTGGKRVRCQIFQHINGALVKQADFEEVINNTGVRVGPFERSAASVWRILIEEVLAFEGQLPYGTSEIARP